MSDTPCRRALALALLGAIAVLGNARAADAPTAPTTAASTPTAEDPIVVQNEYYPKPGLDEDVYQLRLRASAVRAKLGLVEGRVLRRSEGPDGGPAVIWQAEYPNPTARQDDVARLSASAEFKAIQDTMATLVARFERSVWRVAPSAAR